MNFSRASFFLLTFLAFSSPAIELPLRINAGGPAIGKAGDSDYWIEGKKFVKGGEDYKFGGPHDTSKVNAPGPSTIYETVRHQNHRYEIKGLPEGKYHIRFHFTEGVKTNSRAMDYKINGRLVINNLNILKATGGIKRAHIIDTAVTLNGKETLSIEAHEDKGSDVFEAGIEILPANGNTILNLSSRSAPLIAKPIPPQGNLASGSELRDFAGGSVRFVWLQGDDWDSYTKSKSRVALMGLDSDDGRGERKVIPEIGGFSKPLFTPEGGQIVFSDLANHKIQVVDWSGNNRRELGDGLATDVWQDPETKKNWVYARVGSGSKTSIVRRQMDDPSVEEKVWSRTENGHSGVPWFQLSEDGRMFSDAFPWPKCGVGDLTKGSWKQYENGCWPGIAPDNSYRSFVFSGSHTEVNLFDSGGRNQRKVAVNSMPEMKGRKVYFPRWSNDPQFITVIGPEKNERSELYVGKFDKGFEKIEKWVRVTNNSRTELFGDAWFGSAPKVEKTAPRMITEIPIKPDNLPFPEGLRGIWPGSNQQLAWIWESSKSQNEAGEFVCGGDLHGRARFGRFYDLLLDQGSFTASSEAGPHLVEAIKATQRFSIEAVLTPFSKEQSGPARIVSMSKGASARNFTIGQEGDDLIFRIRTGKGDSNGTSRELHLCKILAARPQHLLVTYEDKKLRAYLDGKKVFETGGFSVDFSSWDPSMALILGDEVGGGRDWKGRLEGIAIFARAMSNDEAPRQAMLANKLLAQRSKIDPVVVSAKLLEVTRTPTREEMDSYQRALVENVYEVQKVIEGDIPEMEGDRIIVVRQWVVMDGQELEAVNARKPGLITLLNLEQIEAHPELEGEFRSSDHDRFGAPVLLDMDSHRQ